MIESLAMARSSTPSAAGREVILSTLSALLLALATGCIETPWTLCEDGMVCPPGRACDLVNGRCSLGGDCFEKRDGEPCDGTLGRCLGGVCEDLCGDGEVNGDDECEGTDFVGKSCASEEQTYGGELTCTAECTIDTSGCIGWCGDGHLDEGHEVCDPAGFDRASAPTCVSRGLDAGRLACRGDCAGPTADPCMRFGWSLESSQEGQPSGVFRDLSGGSDVLVAVVERGGVVSASADGAIGWDAVGVDGPTIAGFAVWASSSRDIWVVGEETIIHRWDGEGWTATRTPMEGLTDLWGHSAGDGSPSEVFAVGREGIIRHDGARWSLEPGGRAVLRAVSGVGPDRVYAVGRGGTLLRRDGHKWQAMDSGTSEDLVGVWADPGGDLWTISATSARRFDGRTWRTMSTFEPDGSGQAWIGGTGAHDVWTSAGPGGEVRRYDGRGWSTLREPNQLGPQPLWVDRRSVAVGFQDDSGTVGVSRWFGAGDGRLLAPNGIFLLDAWGNGAEDWIAVGAGGEASPGVALHADGRTTAFDHSLSLVTGFDDGRAYAAGQNGPVHHWDGQGWSMVLPTTEARYVDLWSAGPTDVYALLEAEQDRAARVVRFDGERAAPLPPIDPPCGAGPAAGWSSGPTDVFVVGADLLARFDGTGWTCFDGPAANELFRSVWGSGPGDVWVYQAAGGGGGQARLHHWDGTAWTAQVTTGDGLLTGTAPDDVFLGKSMHFDGHTWTPIRAQSIAGYVAHAAPSRLFSTTPVLGATGLGQFVRTRYWQGRAHEVGCADGVDDDGDGLADGDDDDCARGGARPSR